jgi:predicted nucleic acid-binding protein
MAAIFQRHSREGHLTPRQAQELWELFEADLRGQVWNLLPVSESLMRRVAAATRTLPPDVYLRAGDAVHLVSAREYGFSDIWTSDRRMLAAAPHFGVQGRS